MQYILLILCLIQLAAIVWLVMQVQKLRRPQDDTALRTLRQEIAADTQNQMQMLGNLLSENQRQSGDYQAERLEQMERGMDARLRQFESRVGNLERSNAQGMEQIRSAVAANLHRMQTQQQDSLAEIQSTVNEKLAQSLNQKIGQSFQLVSSRLEQVYQGLGEMQTLAVGVGDLKKVLSNVKTRGILGEIQLGAILQEILSPEQYETEIPTIPGSREHVEFAIRLPGRTGDAPVWLPIDAKFPLEDYQRLVQAREDGDADAETLALKQLEIRLKSEARDIRDKYIAPPYSTDFGLLYLPLEGLFAEAVSRPGLISELQRKYRVTLVGPTTLAAVVNSLQMGFRTLVVQKQTSQVWRLVAQINTDLGAFETAVERAEKKLAEAQSAMESVGDRTRILKKHLDRAEKFTKALDNTVENE